MKHPPSPKASFSLLFLLEAQLGPCRGLHVVSLGLFPSPSSLSSRSLDACRCRHPAHCHKGEQASPALCSEQPRINSGVKEVIFPSENLARARRLPMAENEGEKVSLVVDKREIAE